MIEPRSAGELVDALGSAVQWNELAAADPPLLCVDLTGADRLDLEAAAAHVPALPIVLIGLGADGPGQELVDVVAEDVDAVECLEHSITMNPRAATSLALLLRQSPQSIGAGLAAESAVYSMLQGGPEFAAWRASREPHRRAAEQTSVLMERRDDVLHVTLDRPEVHNALNTRMRDELYEALVIAASDPNLRVRLDGAGPSFCSGGDLDEFGSRSDPSSAHLMRLRRSIGRLIASIADRVEVELHGACFGAGIELPAFAGHVVARADSRIALPEVGLGLIPGAGGTVSVTRRIGRHRTARLALTGEVLDAETALDWGLVDEVTSDRSGRPTS